MMTSEWMRLTNEQLFASGKKVNPNFNFQVGDKVKVINRLMNRIMNALGTSPTSRLLNVGTETDLNGKESTLVGG